MGLGRRDVSQKTPLPIKQLGFEQSSDLPIGVLPDYQQELGNHLTLSLEASIFDPELDGGAEKDASTEPDQIANNRHIDGSVSFDNRRAAQDWLISPGQGQYIALIADADSDLSPYLQCRRIDTDTEIGGYSSQLSLFAAVANKNAWLHISVHVQKAGQGLRYGLYSLSGDETVLKQLFLAFIRRDLSSAGINGESLSPAKVEERARWLASVFHLTFTVSEMDDIEDSATRGIVRRIFDPIRR